MPLKGRERKNCGRVCSPSRGAKKSAMKKQEPGIQAVSPVRPPSLIPVADSMKTVRGLVHIREPTTLPPPSEQYARVERGKSLVSSFTKPAARLICDKLTDKSKIVDHFWIPDKRNPRQKRFEI